MISISNFAKLYYKAFIPKTVSLFCTSVGINKLQICSGRFAPKHLGNASFVTPLAPADLNSAYGIKLF